MRSVSAALKTAMAATPRTLAWLGKFEFADGTTIRVSTLASDITFDDDDSPGPSTWSKDKSFAVSSMRMRGDGSVPDMDVTAPAAISAAYDAEDVYAGTFEGMAVTLYMIDHTAPASGGMQIGPYAVSEIEYDDRGKIARFELRGQLQRAKEIQVEEYTVTCRSDLGDVRPGYCSLPLYPSDVARSTAYALGDYVRVPDGGGDYNDRMFRCTTAGTTAGTAPAYDYTVGNTTADGSAVFTAEQAWVRAGVVATRTDDGDFTATLTEARAVDDWFANSGIIKFLTGANAGLAFHIRKYTSSTKRIQLWGAARWTVAVSDEFEIMPGCDKTFDMCRDRFANSINFRGEHQLPGQDFLGGAGL